MNELMALLDAGIEDETKMLQRNSTKDILGGMIHFTRVSYHLLIIHIIFLIVLR